MTPRSEEDAEDEGSDRPAKRQKTEHDPVDLLALPSGAPTETRRRWYCDVEGCDKTEESRFPGYTAKSTVTKHKNRNHRA